ncbi:MAG: hypothetical protein ABID67_02690 [Candidatus Nealsonbacteria bacterium]
MTKEGLICRRCGEEKIEKLNHLVRIFADIRHPYGSCVNCGAFYWKDYEFKPSIVSTTTTPSNAIFSPSIKTSSKPYYPFRKGKPLSRRQKRRAKRKARLAQGSLY